MSATPDPRPLVVHLLHRFDTGGLENGVANLINRMPAYRHAVVALTEVTAFRERVQAPGVEFHALHKPPGQGLWLYPRVFRLLRQLRPAVLHTRNIGTLEFQIPAWAARVPLRVHGEHGWDINDLGGSNPTYRRLRRLYAPFVHRFVALSKDIQNYLRGGVGVADARIAQVYNGVDLARFQPPAPGEAPPADWPFDPARHWVIGSVGRMQAVKDPLNLVRAFIELLRARPDWRDRARLVMLGDGPLRWPALDLLREAGLAELAWLPGDRRDVAELLRWFELFVLPSKAEGISNTILEAMAARRCVLATAVGGNPELIEHQRTGWLVPPADAASLALALQSLLADPALRERLAGAAQTEAQRRFSLPAMVSAYQALYDNGLSRGARRP